MTNWRNKTFGERLAHLVSLYDTSPGRGGQSALSKLTKGRVKQTTISSAINGAPSASMTVESAMLICEATGADLVWLAAGIGSPPDEAQSAPRPLPGSGISLPESIPVAQRAHLVDLISALARRDPLAIEFIEADMDAIAEGKVLGIAMDAHVRGGLISSYHQRRGGKAKAEPARPPLSAVKTKR